MTLVMGIWYEDKKSALIASDSRMTMGEEYYQIRKVEEVNGLIIATAGDVSLGDGLKDNVQNSLKEFKNNPPQELQTRKMLEIIRESHKKIARPDSEDDEELDYTCEGIFGFNLSQPKIYQITNESTVYRIDEFIAIGAGREIAQGILKKFYNPRMNSREAMDLLVYCILEVSNNNLYVDDTPQIAFIEKDGWKILNLNSEGKFMYEVPEILESKKRMKEFSESQKNFLKIIAGNDDKKKNELERILNND